jgi:protein phosphatase
VAWTDAGIDYKERNEDAFLLVPQKGVFAIADGMGGHVGGEIASCIAIDFLEQGIMKGRSLEEAFVLANEAILTRSWSDSELGGMHPMGCTLIAAQLLGKRLKIAHVGDSKALVIRRGRCVFETQDHTQGQELFHDGFIDLDTAFELNHILNRCLGIDRIQWQRDVELSYVTLEPGDRILLVSDGVTDNFYNNQFEVDDLVAMVSTHDISLAAKKLAQECTRRMKLKELPYHRPAKADNFSFALLEYHP